MYGEDSRRDYFASSNETLRKLTRESIVGLMEASSINDSNPDDIRFSSSTLQQSQGLCASELFLEQPTAAYCSGTLIDDDLVLTAGHCVDPSQFSCSETHFVFNYYLDGPAALKNVTSEDVFRCQEIVAYALENGSSGNLDFAIVKLDRPVRIGKVPARLPINPDAIGVGMPVVLLAWAAEFPPSSTTVDASSQHEGYETTFTQRRILLEGTPVQAYLTRMEKCSAFWFAGSRTTKFLEVVTSSASCQKQ
ncbi:MAG: S1 family peptidase [Deltaproteobacteria bacterium]|nr:S1 family peptidase [Deltaproteobacteria bacterium]